MVPTDVAAMRRCLQVAQRARENGNHPFGALLIDEQGQDLLEAENTVVTQGDCTGHAEMNLIRRASLEFTPEFLAGCTIVASTEPCPMCSGAIFWSGIGRVVFGLSQTGLYAISGQSPGDALPLPCRNVLEWGNRPVSVIGPLLEDEAAEAHIGYWDGAAG